jgi:mRNA deadenylase 3'-5' endonuclease subunit Ccr4
VNEWDGSDLPPPPPSPPPPPQMPDMAKFRANDMQFMMTMMAAMPRQGEQNEMAGCSSANFFRHNSPMFDGSAGPLAADNWFTNFQDLADALWCTDS